MPYKLELVDESTPKEAVEIVAAVVIVEMDDVPESMLPPVEL
jgi:hypothetical protein